MKRPARATTIVMAAAVAATGLGLLPIWLVGGLAVQIRQDLALDEATLGVLTSIYFAVAAVASLPGGWLVDRIGWRRGVLLTGLLSCTALLGVAWQADTWAYLVFFMVIGAVSNGTGQPAANLGLARGIGIDRRGLAFGVKQAAVPLATMISGLAVPLIGLTLGWRWAFVIAGAIALPVVVGLVIASLRGATDTHPGPPAALEAAVSGRPTVAPLVVLFVAAATATAVTNSLGIFFVSFIATGDLGPRLAGYLFAGASAVGVLARVTAGWLADRRGGGHLRMSAAMMLGGALGFLLLALPGPGVAVVAAILCFGLGWSWNGVFAFAIVETVPSAPATVTGVIQTAKNAGGVVGPLAFGLVVSTYSYEVAWRASAGLLVLAASLVLVGHRMVAKAAIRSATRQADSDAFGTA